MTTPVHPVWKGSQVRWTDSIKGFPHHLDEATDISELMLIQYNSISPSLFLKKSRKSTNLVEEIAYSKHDAGQMAYFAHTGLLQED